MRPNAADLFKVFGEHELRDCFIFVVVEAVEDAGADVVDAALLRAVERRRVPVVDALRPARMELRVGRAVEGLLEEDVGAYLRRLETLEFLDGRRGDVDVDSADGVAARVAVGVDSLHALDDVVERRVDGVFAGFHRDTLVAEREYRVGLLVDLLHRELLAEHHLVVLVEAAVGAAVHAVVRDVERREEDDAASVDAFLYLLRERVELVLELGVGYFEEHRRLAVVEAVALARLRDELAHRALVGG